MNSYYVPDSWLNPNNIHHMWSSNEPAMTGKITLGYYEANDVHFACRQSLRFQSPDVNPTLSDFQTWAFPAMLLQVVEYVPEEPHFQISGMHIRSKKV